LSVRRESDEDEGRDQERAEHGESIDENGRLADGVLQGR
jgi:hypothetical protein